MAAGNGLPRLGSSEAGRPDPKTEVVAIPDRGVTVVLRKPSVGTMLDLEERSGSDEDSTREGFASSVALISRMLVEPELSEDELSEEVSGWTFDDWRQLQDAAMKLAGMRREDESAAREEFRGASKS